jgi:hypothetical protein
MEDKRNRGDQQGGNNPGQDRERRKEPKPGGTESPGSGRTRREDEDESQE